MQRCIIYLQELHVFQGLKSEQFANMCACTSGNYLDNSTNNGILLLAKYSQYWDHGTDIYTLI
jgi:hypothetical protein